MKWYLKVLKNYAQFNGRSRRTEYWMFALINLLFCALALIIDNVAGLAFENLFYGPLYILYGLVLFIPGLAVGVRRLHDVGKSGWMILVAFIPLIGAIWLLILFATDSNPGENQFGPNPKEVVVQ